MGLVRINYHGKEKSYYRFDIFKCIEAYHGKRKRSCSDH